MVKITINIDTVNNTIPTTILLDKATTNNSLDEEEVERVETELGEDEKVKEEAVLVEEGMDNKEEDSTMEVEECTMKRLDVLSTKELVYGVLYVKIINKHAEKKLIHLL